MWTWTLLGWTAVDAHSASVTGAPAADVETASRVVDHDGGRLQFERLQRIIRRMDVLAGQRAESTLRDLVEVSLDVA